MVAAVRRGRSLRSVARKFHVSLSTVQSWVERARGRRLDRVDWSDRPPIPHRIQRTATATEDLVLTLRHELKLHSDLGEYGAQAIYRELLARQHPAAPSVRTIGRILERRGALDGRRRVRRPPPPRGWYLPPVAQGRAELDSFDSIEGLVIQDGPQIEVLTVISLHGGLAEAWPATAVTARSAAATLMAHWRQVGLPTYAQFDNDTIFQGPHQHPDVISRVMRTCLSLGVIPVFAPPREQGFQAAIESFNGRWQAKVWARFHHASLASLRDRSARYITALRRRAAVRIEAAPARRSFPPDWEPELQRHPRGTIIFVRRTSEQGAVYLLGRTFPVTPGWPHRLVHAEVDLEAQHIRFYALRRRQPDHQPLLSTVPYVLPRRRFEE